MIPLIKFSDIKKNPQELIIKEGHAAIVRYSDVVGFVVEPERMKQLIDAETKSLNYLDALRKVASGQLCGDDLINLD
ncbi:MAG: hypothetical protein GAK29_01480 [Acinetobacter bereziniae]|uniref:Antitoxin n=1 Tax=Acinetobacter bereziniae TaxID=106648 RepID=A0A833PDI8_ACIBZ|nr:MAG: hypothetical protein GAK29_01480 [Acinetobacter bereziniae]